MMTNRYYNIVIKVHMSEKNPIRKLRKSEDTME